MSNMPPKCFYSLPCESMHNTHRTMSHFHSALKQTHICHLIRFPFFASKSPSPCLSSSRLSSNLSFWQRTEDESVFLFIRLKKKKKGPWEAQRCPCEKSPASYLHMCAICLRAVCVRVRASLIHWARSLCLAASSHAPPKPPPPTHTHTQTNTQRGKSFLTFMVLMGVGGRWRREANRGEREHKEKAWLVCEFSTCNLSYSELSCSLLFGSHRLMPGVCLNKSTTQPSR